MSVDRQESIELYQNKRSDIFGVSPYVDWAKWCDGWDEGMTVIGLPSSSN